MASLLPLVEEAGCCQGFAWRLNRCAGGLMSPAVEVLRIDASCRAALDETGALLVDAFHDSPLFVTAFPSKRTRDRVLRMLFDALVDDTARFGGLHIASCNTVIVGALLWYGPGDHPMTLLRILRQLPRFLAIVAKSARGVFELRRAQQAFELRRPQEPHAQACWLAGRAGERVGVQLARALIAGSPTTNGRSISKRRTSAR
jgi:hypothetical protein